MLTDLNEIKSKYKRILEILKEMEELKNKMMKLRQESLERETKHLELLQSLHSSLFIIIEVGVILLRSWFYLAIYSDSFGNIVHRIS